MYWDEIWEAADPKRISAYVKKIDLAPDDVIRYLHKRGAVSVCDAGCGCGTFSLKLAANGFSVYGFDIAEKERVSRTVQGGRSDGYRISGSCF